MGFLDFFKKKQPKNRAIRNVLFCYFSQTEIDYTPIDIGYIIAAIQQKIPINYDFKILPLLHKRNKRDDPDERTLVRLKRIRQDARAIIEEDVQAVFFFVESVVWSKVFALERANAIASIVRARKGRTFLGLCGYKIQDFQAKQALESGLFDCVVFGDQEKAFLSLPDIFKKKKVEGVAYAGDMDAFEKKAPHPVLKEATATLDAIPSPYLSHVLDAFLLEKQKETEGTFRAYLSSSRGCPFGCFYCARSVKFEKVRYFSAKRFYDEIEYLLSDFGIVRFFVLDDAFLCSKQRLAELLKEFEDRKKKNPFIGQIKLFVMARPETLDQDVIDCLAKLRVKDLQIGLQTINPSIEHYMMRSKRIDVDYFLNLTKWIHKHHIRLQIDVILGMPNDTIEMFKETLLFAIAMKPRSIQLKQLYINPYTLFHVEKEKYGLQIDQERDFFDEDYDAPYVVSAKGIDPAYYVEANKFVLEQVEKTPDIRWKYLAKEQRYVSPNFLGRARPTLEDMKKNNQADKI